MFERILKYFQQRPIAERLGCHMQNFINLQIISSCIKNFPSGDVLGLAGYTQSSGPGQLRLYDDFVMTLKY